MSERTSGSRKVNGGDFIEGLSDTKRGEGTQTEGGAGRLPHRRGRWASGERPTRAFFTSWTKPEPVLNS